MNDWYQQLIRPEWAPPATVFGPVWSFLYAVIAVSFGYVFYLAVKKKVRVKIFAPFLLNLLFNFVFTPIQFGLKNNFLAAVDIFLVLITLVWAMIAIWPHARWVALINIPYLFWVVFATILQFTITFLNI